MGKHIPRLDDTHNDDDLDRRFRLQYGGESLKWKSTLMVWNDETE